MNAIRSLTISLTLLALTAMAARYGDSLSLRTRKGEPMSFGIYAIGFVIMLIGVVYGAYLMHIPTHWIAVGAIVLLGVGILSGVKATRQRDSSE
jgi:hypothetical protein